VILAGFSLLEWQNPAVKSAADRLAESSDAIKYLSLLPMGILVWTFRHARSMLFPDADSRSILQRWENYQTFRDIVAVGVFYSIVFAMIGVLSGMINWKGDTIVFMIWMCASIAGSSLCALSMYVAEIEMTENFKKYGGKL